MVEEKKTKRRKLIGFIAGEKGRIGKLQALALGMTGFIASGLIPKITEAWNDNRWNNWGDWKDCWASDWPSDWGADWWWPGDGGGEGPGEWEGDVSDTPPSEEGGGGGGGIPHVM